MVKRRGGTHYEPISWDDAFGLIAERLGELDSPDEAVFYTSGRTSNEAAFAYQLFVRAFGTNNMPDCSNMCHESTSVALAEVIGIGKGSVHLEDIYSSELVVVIGQNPGTNHPRMLTALETAKKNGAKILAINPLKEAGFVRFRNPQNARGLSGIGTALADLHLPVRVNGDLALFQAIGSLLLKWGCIDEDFVKEHTVGYDAWAAHVAEVDWAAVERATGLDRALIEEAAGMFRDSGATVLCWAMGITQHRNAVATIKEFTNVALLQGNIGKPGAGLCPVRGHSNVQGDRTMGIWERPPQHFLDALQKEFGFDPPREDGLDTVASIRALSEGTAKVFFAMGGNFVAAAPDTHVTEAAMRRAALTVQVSTKLNRSHVVPGRGGPDPADARSQRAGPHRWRGPTRHRRGLHVGGARLPRPAQAGQPAPAVRGRHRLLAGRGRARGPARPAVGRVPGRLHRRSGAGSPTSCRAARRTTRRSTSPVASCCRIPHGTRGPFPPSPARRCSRSVRSTCCTCPRGGC